METMPATERPERIRSALLRWYRRHRRRLPWREDPAPWRVLVSELMLQQTRVEAVVPHFERFVRRYPDPAALAAASEEEVLAAWTGLGYYRRARSLREAAVRIRDEHRGRVPGEIDRLRELPGVGEYTAAAVGSIAFGRAAAVVDGNVERVVARLYALPGRRGDGPLRRCVATLADELLDRAAPGDFNQAMMELGARVCLPRGPSCLVCPLQEACESSRDGRAEERPARPRTRAPEDVVRTAAMIVRAGRVLLVRRPDDGRMAGMLELPTAAGGPDRLAARLAELGLDAAVGQRVATVRHAVLHRRILQHVHEATLRAPARRSTASAWRFTARRELASRPLTGATVKSLAAAGFSTTGRTA